MASKLAVGLALAIGLIILFFVGLGSYPIIDPDETVYAQIATEKVQNGDWMTPYYAGKIWFDKPPLMHWLMAASISVFGQAEAAYRLPSALAAVLVVFLVFWLAAHDFGRRIGVLAALVMATCIQQTVLARACVTDMTLTACVLGALYSYRRWIDSEGGQRYGWALLFGTCAGLSVVTKSPAYAILLCFAALLHMWVTHRLRLLASVPAMVGLLVTAVVGLPWYVIMYQWYGDSFVEGFLVANNLTRFTQALHPTVTGGWYSYLLNFPILLGFFFPWSVFLPQAFMKYRKANDGAILAAIWIIVVFIVFSLSKTILVTYIFPLYPMAAILIAALWSKADELRGGALVWFRVSQGIQAVVSLALVVLGASLVASKYPEVGWVAYVLFGLLSLGVIVSLILSSTGSKGMRAAPWALGLCMVLFAGWLTVVVMPRVAPRLSARDIVRAIPAPNRARVVTFDLAPERYRTILFYLGREAENTFEIREAIAALSSSTPVYLISKDYAALEISRTGAQRLAAKGGNVLFANKAAVALTGRR